MARSSGAGVEFKKLAAGMRPAACLGDIHPHSACFRVLHYAII
ncbi:hypothetical protein XBJ1_1340 [Xenorhabdus bovienii SS-2004]|uniref:Uncharacterized protein n=1 Tax=Xenorhabdus bovienii (strain SS-2004) TaxID=406818 RepID=D3UXU8_XENBS|nr:hypothetical protein XBJ1_1340 [Xenorhabdus bovienii SS-2004]